MVAVCEGLVHSAACRVRSADRLRCCISGHFSRVLRTRRRRTIILACRSIKLQYRYRGNNAAGSSYQTDRVRIQCRVPGRLQLRQPVAVYVPTSHSAFRLQLAADESCSVSRPTPTIHD